MTSSKNILKVPDGKLIKIFLEYEDGEIKEIKITGDFFVYPEESVEKLEAELVNLKLRKDMLERKIGKFIKSNNVQLFGITIPALVEAIMGAAA